MLNKSEALAFGVLTALFAAIAGGWPIPARRDGGLELQDVSPVNR